MLEFLSAANDVVNTTKAVQQAISSIQDQWNEKSIHTLVIHATIGHQLKELLSEAKRLCPDSKIVGCTCAGVIGYNKVYESMRALSIMAISTDIPNELVISHSHNILGKNSFKASKEMARNLKSMNSDINMLMLLVPGMDIAADQVLQGIESEFGESIPIFGGSASDNMKSILSYQFLDEQVFEHTALLIGFADKTLDVHMGVHHGSIPLGDGFTVTKSEGNHVFEIENKPAWQFLMDELNLAHETHPGPCIPIAGLGEYLDSTLHEEYNNKHILRVITKVNPDYSFYLPVNCPTGTRLFLTQRNEDLIFSGLELLTSRMKQEVKDKEIVAVFHTDCAARGRALFDIINKEEIIQNMQDLVRGDSPVPWLGMYGYGEFAQLGNRNRFHNYTSSLYLLTRKQEFKI